MKINPTYEKVISGYSKFEGITNLFGLAWAFFIGVILILIGIV